MNAALARLWRRAAGLPRPPRPGRTQVRPSPRLPGGRGRAGRRAGRAGPGRGAAPAGWAGGAGAGIGERAAGRANRRLCLGLQGAEGACARRGRPQPMDRAGGGGAGGRPARPPHWPRARSLWRRARLVGRRRRRRPCVNRRVPRLPRRDWLRRPSVARRRFPSGRCGRQ